MSNTGRIFLSAMQICNFLFSWRDFITSYERLNLHDLEILGFQQFKIQNSKFKIFLCAPIFRGVIQ